MCCNSTRNNRTRHGSISTHHSRTKDVKPNKIACSLPPIESLHTPPPRTPTSRQVFSSDATLLHPQHPVLAILSGDNRLCFLLFVSRKLDQNIPEFSLGELLRRVHVCHGAPPEFVETRDEGEELQGTPDTRPRQKLA